MLPPTGDSFQAYLNAQMVQTIGLLLGALLTGILFSTAISSLFLLSSREVDKNLLRRNRFLCVYIIVLLLTVLIFYAEGFVVVIIFFSQPQDTAQKMFETWNNVTNPTTGVIILLADGVLVRLQITMSICLAIPCF